MSRLKVEAAPLLRLVPDLTGRSERHWLVLLEGVTVAHVTAGFDGAGAPTRVEVQVDVDVPVQRTGGGWLVDLGLWADYRCAGCGLPGEGTPWRALLGQGETERFHGPGCLAAWVEHHARELPT